MSDEHGEFAQSIAAAISSGVSPVVVHGGGPQINLALKEAGIESHFIGGFRVTDAPTFDVVEKVLVDEVGPVVATSLRSQGVEALAMSGRTSGVLIAKQQRTLVDGTTADLGLVGEIIGVDPGAIISAVSTGKVPVISPIACDSTGTIGYNVNADIAAAAIAGALDAEWLIIMTDVAGIYRNWPDKNSIISSITASELSDIKATFAEGMAPKVQACLDAIAAGAKAVRIIDGTDPSALKSALLGQGGTLVMA